MILNSLIKNSNKDAVITDAYTVSYAELYEKSCLIHSFLSDTCGFKKIIPLIFTLPEYYIYGLIGVLFSNNIIMPLDSAHPIDKLMEYIKITECLFVITDKKISARIIKALDNIGIKIICIEDILLGSAYKAVHGYKDANENDAAYIYFTSGSTGKSKAVLGRNGSLSHFIKWETEEFNVNDEDTFAQMTSPAFDPYLRDIFTPLAQGAKIRLVNKNICLVSRLFGNFLHESKITFLHTTPSILKNLLNYKFPKDHFSRLRYILTAGESLTRNLVISWYNNYDRHSTLVNIYGPTETTLAKVFTRIPYEFSCEIVPVGKPICDAKVYIINDETGIECNEGDTGEVYIETDYMTHGYYNDKESPSFGVNQYQKKWYATGDFGYIKDEDLFITGRKDEQKKIGGVRIDLNEIKNIVLSYTKEKMDDCVILYEDDLLLAFYISHVELNLKSIRAFMELKLVPIHIPHKFIKVDHFPVTLNGKTDKNKMLRDYYDKVQ